MAAFTSLYSDSFLTMVLYESIYSLIYLLTYLLTLSNCDSQTLLTTPDCVIDNKFAKLHAKRLNQSENIPKSFRGLLFLNTLYWPTMHHLATMSLLSYPLLTFCVTAKHYLAVTMQA